MAQAVECAIAVHQLSLDSQGSPSVWLHPSANRVLPLAWPQSLRARKSAAPPVSRPGAPLDS